MHWSKNIIALRAQGRTIQIFDLSAKQKLKSAVMNDDVVYWKWFSERSLGLVTESSVYHWDVFDPTQAQPLKVFDRLPNLSVRTATEAKAETWLPGLMISYSRTAKSSTIE
jgi:clathrin heavy chain